MYKLKDLIFREETINREIIMKRIRNAMERLCWVWIEAAIFSNKNRLNVSIMMEDCLNIYDSFLTELKTIYSVLYIFLCLIISSSGISEYHRPFFVCNWIAVRGSRRNLANRLIVLKQALIVISLSRWPKH